MAKLTVEHLSKRFDASHVLKDIHFSAKPGDLVSVIGPSGCGKTTLLRCVLGELEPDEGRILIDDEEVTHTKVSKRGVGIVYQRYALFPHMTVRSNLEYGLRVRGESRERMDSRVERLVEMVSLEGKEDQFPERLSGGERQRVALARALAVEPRVLLLDEAFTALDASTRHQVIQEVRAIIARLKLTTLLVTHDQEEAFLFSARVIVLNEGKVIVDGDPQTVMRHPHPFIQSFVKMAVFHQGLVEQDSRGKLYVPLPNGHQIPISIPGIAPGDQVQVMVKKSGESERIEVFRGPRPNNPT